MGKVKGGTAEYENTFVGSTKTEPMKDQKNATRQEQMFQLIEDFKRHSYNVEIIDYH
jgi:hypothetical protein